MITLKFRQNTNRELEHTFASFKGEYQSPLLMVIKEYWLNNDVVWARVLWDTHFNLRRILQRLIGRDYDI